LSFVGKVDPKVVILGHGEPASKEWFAEQIRSKYPNTEVRTTKPGHPLEC
jgi:predicted metal-dependent RNase